MRVEPKPGLDTGIFLDVIENGDAMARTKLALQLAGLMCAEDSCKADVARASGDASAADECMAEAAVRGGTPEPFAVPGVAQG